MITANFANDQNREVFAIPGSILNKKSTGTNKLIQTGRAKSVSVIEDILEEFECLSKQQSSSCLPIPDYLSDEEKQILSALSNVIHIDDLSDILAREPQELLINLLNLELQGFVRQLPGKHFESIVKFG